MCVGSFRTDCKTYARLANHASWRLTCFDHINGHGATYASMHRPRIAATAIELTNSFHVIGHLLDSFKVLRGRVFVMMSNGNSINARVQHNGNAMLD